MDDKAFLNIMDREVYQDTHTHFKHFSGDVHHLWCSIYWQ